MNANERADIILGAHKLSEWRRNLLILLVSSSVYFKEIIDFFFTHKNEKLNKSKSKKKQQP